jgi:hypothetical protein
MTAYDASQWTDFFVAGAGASAALAGLVFGAVSINVDRILDLRGLPEQALATVMCWASCWASAWCWRCWSSRLRAGAWPVATDSGCTPSPSGCWSALEPSRCAGGGEPVRRGRRRALLGGGRDRARDDRRGGQRLSVARGDFALAAWGYPRYSSSAGGLGRAAQLSPMAVADRVLVVGPRAGEVMARDAAATQARLCTIHAGRPTERRRKRED